METTKKYELSNITIEFNGVTLYRIKALKDFSDVKAGDLGGWVEKEDNLSQSGDAWIGGDAKVYGNAVVCDNAKVFGKAKVHDNAFVRDNAWVYDNAQVYGRAKVFGNAVVFVNAEVYDHADVYCHAMAFGNAEICGNAGVCGYAEICGDAVVKNNEDYIVFKNFWGSGRHFTWTRSNNMWKAGCFYGTGEELIEKAYADSETSGIECEKIVRLTGSTIDALNLFKFFTNGSKKEI